MLCSVIRFTKSSSLYLFFGFLFISVSVSYAHVDLLNPEEGNMFSPGDTINIKWETVIEHDQNNWDLSYSKDSGQTWQSIKKDLPVSQTSYKWDAPEIMSDKVFIRVTQDNNDFNYSDKNGPITISHQTTDLGNLKGITKQLKLGENYPNPFNPVTNIPFHLESRKDVIIQVYDLNGKIIRTLVNKSMDAGRHTVPFLAFDIPSGTYFYRLQAEKESITKKMTLIK